MEYQTGERIACLAGTQAPLVEKRIGFPERIAASVSVLRLVSDAVSACTALCSHDPGVAQYCKVVQHAFDLPEEV